jgi:UDP-N-acetylmuramoyl-tripeptide--D-alanyl-D-alanine ligase
MTMWQLSDAQAAVTDSHVTGAPSTAFTRIVTDSRSVQPGDLFVAIKGERFDAHDFLTDVARCRCGRVARAGRVRDAGTDRAGHADCAG